MKTDNEIYSTKLDNEFIETTIERIKNDPGPLQNPKIVAKVAEMYKDKTMVVPMEVIIVSLAFLDLKAMDMVEAVVKRAKEVTMLNEKMKKVKQISEQKEVTQEDIKEVLNAVKQLANLLS